jgi:hypothetical protein
VEAMRASEADAGDVTVADARFHASSGA